MSRIKVSHQQMQITPGDYAANTRKIFATFEEAAAEKVDVLSFPESSLTGYFQHEEKAREFSLDRESPEVVNILEESKKYDFTFMFGLNERRGEEMFNSVFVCEKGEILDVYSKAFPCFTYFTPGRHFPVFEKNGIKFGVVICADGRSVDASRILALKGAQVIIAPHYNYVDLKRVVSHSRQVFSDHVARAVENNIWFLRGNNVGGLEDKGFDFEGVAYGESYLLNPSGEVAVSSQRHREGLMSYVVEIDEKGEFYVDTSGAGANGQGTRRSGEALHHLVSELLQKP